MTKQRKLGHKVSPRSAKSIVSVAQKFKDLVYEVFENLDDTRRFVPIIEIYDQLQDIEFLEYEIVEDSELNGQLALTYPDKGEIKISETVFNGACAGEGFHRFTLAHELGHLLLHTNQKPTVYARGKKPEHKVFEDSEWQADEWAGAFLVDSRTISGREDYMKISQDYGVSKNAAKTNLGKIKKRMN